MKLATYVSLATGRRSIGVATEEGLLDLPAASSNKLPSDMIEFLRLGDEGMEIAREIAEKRSPQSLLSTKDIRLLAPVPRPGKILHTSCNFGDHLKELTQWNMPEWKAHNWGTFHFEHPTGFLEAPSSIIGPEETIIRPRFTKQLDYEIELGIIIGRTAKNATLENAQSFVAGYTIFNDISARDIQAREHANKVILLGKSFDTSCPLGPYLVTRDEIPDPLNRAMRLWVNGELHQNASTSDMIYKPDQLVSWWSNMTLEPGDLITSGSPPGVIAGWENPVWLKEGDVIEAEIEGLGRLRNVVTESGEG